MLEEQVSVNAIDTYILGVGYPVTLTINPSVYYSKNNFLFS